MAEDERRVGPKIDTRVFRDELNARLARKARAHKDRKNKAGPAKSLSRGRKPE